MTTWNRLLTAALLAASALLTGCASSGDRFTIDDGRPVDPTLLGSIVAYGHGERAIRPAIARTARLNDPECDKQWELPFAVASSAGWQDTERVAWKRGLDVDERPTVIAVAPDSPLQLGDRIVRVSALDSKDWEQQMLALATLRDRGEPYDVTLASGRKVAITPFSVCRGYSRFAPPNTPTVQDYHWLMTVHPLEVPLANLSDDEALWLVLWGQGVSEEGGARMKGVSYGLKFVSTIYNVYTIATGLRGAALAAEAAVNAARTAATQVASEVLKQQLIDQGKELAAAKLREGLTEALGQISRGQMVDALQRAAQNRGSLSGISYIASTAFEKADVWALSRMQQLGGDPMAAWTLHQKLVQRELLANSLVFDADRLANATKWAQAQGFQAEVSRALQGLEAESLQQELASMPLATKAKRFSYTLDTASATSPFAQGLIEATTSMPVASKKDR
ncbi:MAG: hypothetical protein ACK520_03750 [Inhella sp.]|uniref:hypothetical protein n=1 Tax=Inhella sp. TaxID=1921806 RepID=UPI0022BCA8E9|nr:hypothetical protein [Inhella sp.]MCZ8233587.1 hypothetical protein [Inhella sp.]